MLLLAGLLLIVLGLISGAALLAAAIGWLTLAPSVTLWGMFPFGSALGLLLGALRAPPRTAPHFAPRTPKSRRLIANVVSNPASFPIFGRSRTPRNAGRNWMCRVTPWIVRLPLTMPFCTPVLWNSSVG